MKAKQKINYILFAPFITLGILMILYAISGIYPFGPNTTAVGDGIAQYVPFLSELAYKIKEGGSLFFTWHAGRGVNFWANLAYYLASPFNIIALFYDSAQMCDAFSLISLIKPAFAALTFSIYLQKTYNKNDISITIFSVLWSFSSFIIATIYVATWIDAIIYFPLVIMGLQRLMDGKSGWQYSLFLGLTIASNFYFGYMTCIFCIIYFIYYLISDDEVVYEGVGSQNESQDSEESDGAVNVIETIKNSFLLKTGFRFVLASLLGGALTALLSVPTAIALSNTGKGVTDNITIIIGNIWNVLASHALPLKSLYTTMSAKDVLFCFTSIVTLILTVAYFFAKGISIRKKIGNLFLLAVMWVSMIFFGIYAVWHAFSIPAGIVMHRYVFIYIFILLKIAYEAFINIEKINIKGVVAGALFGSVCIAGIKLSPFICQSFYSAQLIAVLAVFLVAYAAIISVMAKKEKARKLLSVLLVIIISLEIVILNRDNILYNEWGNNISDGKLVSEVQSGNETGEYIQIQLKEQKFRDNIMCGLLHNYNSNDYYSSLADYNYISTQCHAGSYGNFFNLENGAQEQTPIVNMMFPVKYFIDGSGNVSESEFRKIIKSKDGYSMFENQFTMPFMYTVSPSVANWNPFIYPISTDFQNAAFKAYTATDKNVIIYNENTKFEFENCYKSSYLEAVKDQAEDQGLEWNEHNDEYYSAIEKKMAAYTVKFKDRTKDAYVHFEAIAQSDGIEYIYVDTTAFTDMKITVNGETKSYYTYGIGDNRMYELGCVKKGDVIKVSLGGHKKSDEDVSGAELYGRTGETFAAIGFTVDMDVFREGYNKLDAMSDTEMIEFSDTHVKAKVTSYEDGLLYIPTTFDEGWTITIDGNKVPLYEHESHILMTEISKGEHIVEMKYCPQGFVAGAVITGISLVILVAWAVISKKRSDKVAVCDTIEENAKEE